MTRESKIALLVGLGFIICFGVIISGSRHDSPAQVAGAADMSIGGRTDRDGHAVPLVVPLPPLIRTSHAPRAVEPVAIQPTPPQHSVAPPEPVQTEPPAPQPQRARVYTVQPGDRLSRIAQKVYGSSSREAYMRIYNANRDVLTSPSMVVPGQRLRIPAPDGEPTVATRQLAPQRPAGRTYVVQPGDTLTEIARKTMGTSSRSAVRALHEMNRQAVPDPDRVHVGVVLVIPQ